MGDLEKELRMKQSAQTKLCWEFENLGLFDQFKTQLPQCSSVVGKPFGWGSQNGL